MRVSGRYPQSGFACFSRVVNSLAKTPTQVIQKIEKQCVLVLRDGAVLFSLCKGIWSTFRLEGNWQLLGIWQEDFFMFLKTGQ